MTIIDSQYFPSLEYFSFVKTQSEIYIDGKENFVKQTYRNRCYIMGSNQVLPLAIPMKGGNRKTPMELIELDYTHKWLNNHWRAIISAYNKSPFFEYYEPYIHDILFRKHEKLFDLNVDILTFCLKTLNIDIDVKFTESYIDSSEKSVIDMRSIIHPKKEYVCRNLYTPIPYKQIFGNIFVPNLSILDLLSCVGPESDTYL
ncbi:MAG: WbqC family protein [Reichenbachiella sp.]